MENENKKFYLSEFSYFDGEYDVTFNILDVNFDRKTITSSHKPLRKDNARHVRPYAGQRRQTVFRVR